MASQKLLSSEIRDHFTRKSDYRLRFKQGSFYHPYDRLLIEFVRNNLDKGCKILEVGGGTGYKLDLLASTVETEYIFNCEFIPNIYKNQIRNTINLIGGDALSLPFTDNCFDLVFSINLLHHLVGPTMNDSKNNQVLALSEMLRVVKRDGFIIIGEICNKSRFIRTIIYYLCRTLSNTGMEIKLFGIYDCVIVYFMTPSELISNIDTLKNNSVILSRMMKFWPLIKFDPKGILSRFLQTNLIIILKKL